jgi:uncharacterized membrane protein
MAYETAKFIHIVGVLVLVGNVTATAIWKFFADKTGDARIVGFSQRLVTVTDWSLTFWGVIFTVVGGYSAAAIGQMNVLADRWLVLGQMLFLLSGLMWVAMLIPLQVRMARLARQFEDGGPIPAKYAAASRAWFVVGVIATVPLIAATWVMIAKPY